MEFSNSTRSGKSNLLATQRNSSFSGIFVILFFEFSKKKYEKLPPDGHIDIFEEKLDHIYDNRNFAIQLKEDFQLLKMSKSTENVLRGISHLAHYCEKHGSKYMVQALAQEYNIQV